MSVTADAMPTREAPKLPFHRLANGLIRDPLKAFQDIGKDADGKIVELHLGGFKPYLVTHPDHVQYVLSDNSANFRREGMMWKPLSRLTGETGGEGPEWLMYRKIYQNLLSGPRLSAVTDGMAAAINEAVDELQPDAREGRPIDVAERMTGIIYRAISRIFVGETISKEEIDALGRAVLTATTSSFRARMLMPFVPTSIPLPGDRTFHRAVRDVDDLILPIVRKARREGSDGADIVSMLLRARDEHGELISDQQVRDGVVGLFTAATETTVTALTFLWPLLAANPDVTRRLYDEIDDVIGDGRPTSAHVPKLKYTKMVLLEALRLYPTAWITPRKVAADDVVDGVRLKAGRTVLISPYLTQRLPEFWQDPDVFDPERFAPHKNRHRFAYLAFGAGPHKCVGRPVFTVESQLIVSSLLSRYRPELSGLRPLLPRVGLTLKSEETVEMVLRPLEGVDHA